MPCLQYRISIGGLGGNSMPPDSTEIWQEGAAIMSAKLVSNGEFNEKEMVDYLTGKGHEVVHATTSCS
jgi:5-oxoprolinase (ATP-hydrolysing)